MKRLDFEFNELSQLPAGYDEEEEKAVRVLDNYAPRLRKYRPSIFAWGISMGKGENPCILIWSEDGERLENEIPDKLGDYEVYYIETKRPTLGH